MNYSVGVILTILAIVSPPFSGQAAVDFEGCKACHQEILNSSKNRRFLHSPFAEGQCGDCHAAEEPAAQSGMDSFAGSDDRQEIQRLVESEKADITHGFLLPGEKVGDTLIINLRGDDGKVSNREIAVPPLVDLAEVEDSGRPPIISGVQVLQVQRKVLVSATIGWQTDTITNAVVRYGDTDLTQTSEPGPDLGRQHQVVLYNLKSDQTYRYSVVSTDLFGRSQASAPLEFSTANPNLTSPSGNSGKAMAEGEEAETVANFHRFGSDYFLELSLKQPAWVLISSRGENTNAARNRGLPDDEFHADLSSTIVSSMIACLNCHNAHAHPLNVVPSPIINVSQEYPTLPDGRITCSSCHAPHGSDYLYLTRKHFQGDLCTGCHTDKPLIE
jgi:predicted CXXCH cytochrome family protein